jgi:hypothetical protein
MEITRGVRFDSSDLIPREKVLHVFLVIQPEAYSFNDNLSYRHVVLDGSDLEATKQISATKIHGNAGYSVLRNHRRIPLGHDTTDMAMRGYG